MAIKKQILVVVEEIQTSFCNRRRRQNSKSASSELSLMEKCVIGGLTSKVSFLLFFFILNLDATQHLKPRASLKVLRTNVWRLMMQVIFERKIKDIVF
ncbi:hypothetical protein TNIN_454991 [Trichonephila inaurata madagascariensis]|uniref:Uncharacterized protein n=1 Tax=Trichonephila inaurata madagascariensis TaxID=2747483 RepID=A0A8X6YVG9_9ARAC|nr:hypothetical protein TNIN_454991 [Trichonephila inaurata madagascariensis]